MSVSTYISLRELLSTWNGGIMAAADGDSILDKIGIEDYRLTQSGGVPTAHLVLAFEGELAFSLPGVDAVSLILGSGSTGTTSIAIDAEVDEGITITFTAEYAIRFSADFLRPMKSSDGGVTWEADTLKDYIELTIASTSITVTSAGTVSIDSTAGIDFDQPAMIGETGVIIERADLELNLDGTGTAPVDAPTGWKGLMINNAVVRVPNLFDGSFTATGLGIGASGITGTIGATFALNSTTNPCTGDLVGQVCGMSGGIESISMSFIQNIPSACSIAAQCYLPFFNADSPLSLSVSVCADGSFDVALTSMDPENGLCHLEVGDLGDLYLNGLQLGALEDGTAYVELAGSLDISNLGGVDLPEVSVNGLRITSDGKISMEGGGIALEGQVVVDLKGFQLQIDAIGFGTEEDKKFVSFSGGVKLTEALPMGVSAKGLQVLWDEAGQVELRCDGIGISFEIPDVLSISGSVDFDDANERFAGKGSLILTKMDMCIDAAFVVGKAPSSSGSSTYNYFGIQLETQLPFGIPLGSTGVALYGFSGLYAQNMAPLTEEGVEGYSFDTGTFSTHTFTDGEFDWYRDWYKSWSEPWTPQEEAFGFGVGTVFGTQADNGYMISIEKVLVFSFPGPIIMLQGKGNILRSRTDVTDDSKTKIFTSLILFDGNDKSILAALGMEYALPAEGTAPGAILDAQATSEAFFDFDEPSNWHVYLGEEEEEKRIRAEVFKLFKADSYLMLDSTKMSAGASIGIEASFDFAVVSAGIKAWLAGDADITWVPQHLRGELSLEASLWLEAFGFDFSMDASADIQVQTPTPKELIVDLDFTLDLPWPFDPVDVDIHLEWKESHSSSPVSPVLKEANIRDYITTDAWPLTLTSASCDTATAVSDIEPYISAGSDDLNGGMPLDARPTATFNRNVNDITGIAADTPDVDDEDGGDRTYSYEFSAVEMRKWELKADGSEGWSDPLDLTAFWQETGDDAATMLEIYGDGPFSFCRNNTSMASGDVADAPASWTPFTDSYLATHSDYPGIDLSSTDLDFEDYNIGDVVATHPLGPVFSATPTVPVVRLDPASIESLPIAVTGWDVAGSLTSITVTFPAPVQLKKMKFFGVMGATPPYAQITGTRMDGSTIGARFDLLPRSESYTMPSGFENVTRIVITGANAFLEGFSYIEQATVAEAYELSESAADLLEVRLTLEPETVYRIKLETKTYTDGTPSSPTTRYAFFKTEGPPIDLAPYLESEVPASPEKPHYASYDMTLLFAQNYMQAMYADDITASIVDENGVSVVDSAGDPITLDTYWRSGVATIPYTTLVYLGALTDAGVGVDEEAAAKNDILDVRITSGDALPANKKLELRLQYPDYTDPIHSIVFTTSRYSDFSAVVADFRTEAWSETVVDAPVVADLSDFDAAMAAFGLGTRNLPDRPDVTALWATDLGTTAALLVEFPEPVDWDRTEISVSHPTGTVTRLVNDDGTRALLYAASGTALASWPAGDYTLGFTFNRYVEGLPELRKGGSASDELPSVTIRVS